MFLIDKIGQLIGQRNQNLEIFDFAVLMASAKKRVFRVIFAERQILANISKASIKFCQMAKSGHIFKFEAYGYMICHLAKAAKLFAHTVRRRNYRQVVVAFFHD